MKKIIIITFTIIVYLASCTKETSQSTRHMANREKLNYSKDYLTWEQVENNLIVLDAQEIDIPNDYKHSLSKENYQWTKAKLYKNGDKHNIVYIWESPDNIGFKKAEEDCHHLWYSNGDCKDDGTQCDVIVVDGEIVIICCEDSRFLTWNYVNSIMQNINAIEIEMPQGFAYSLAKEVFFWQELSLFKHPISGEIYQIYKWKFEDIDLLKKATKLCNHVFFNNGDCKDKGDQCEVTIENGKVIIVRCDQV